MKRISLLENYLDADNTQIGGKGVWLAKLYDQNIRIPKTICLTTAAYEHFIDSQGLREKIALELNRKEFKDMRWEEIWDASLRIRNLFLQSPFPPDLYDELADFLKKEMGNTATAVRSSAPDEDQQESSYAGLHDSFLNISGIEQIAHCIKKVWSSLWSDRALLYRKELALSVSASSMAVVIQQLVEGNVSGICFTQNPLDEKALTIEAVYGLNQGLVDGDIDPDRWDLAKDNLAIQQHTPPSKRKLQAVPVGHAVEIQKLPKELKDQPPLRGKEVQELGKMMAQLETLYGLPLDIEWTKKDNDIFVLQTRPITTLQSATGKSKDERSWYLSLHRSLENLKLLRNTIEFTMLPEMTTEAEQMAQLDLSLLSDFELAEEIRRRQERNGYWTDLYWRDCIPFAHGIRLFGEVYNDLMIPQDPHEFVLLLSGENMLSLQRNTLIEKLADYLRKDPKLLINLKEKGIQEITNLAFIHLFDEMLDEHGSYFITSANCTSTKEQMLSKVIIEYAQLVPNMPKKTELKGKDLQTAFIEKLAGSGYGFEANDFLDLARASYRIRDDDNIYLGRIEQQAANAVNEGKRRLGENNIQIRGNTGPADIANLLCGIPVEQSSSSPGSPQKAIPPSGVLRARQLLGQPASQGVARGKARVIRTNSELADFKVGEILVIESIDPTMTFFAPLAAAIVEQRGGMLIHGAIIAREYGIPCITGIARATEYIKTGDTLTIDGYLGIVTLDGNSVG